MASLISKSAMEPPTLESITDVQIEYMILNHDSIKPKFVHDPKMFDYIPPFNSANDAIFASSRGKYMLKFIKDKHPSPYSVVCKSFPGASLNSLITKAEFYVQHHTDPTNTHLYFLAGLCDLTTKLKAPILPVPSRFRQGAPYEEVIFTSDGKVQGLKKTIDHAVKRLLPLGCKPVFSTVAPCSILDWNLLRFEQGKTSYLQHREYYDVMQEELNAAVVDINRYIFHVNRTWDMATPDIAAAMSHCKKGHRRFHLNRLLDGVHPDDLLKKAWAAKIQNSINQNRGYEIIPEDVGPIVSVSDEEEEFENWI